MKNGRIIALGIEGSANKCGVGVVDGDGAILSNPRHTYVSNARHALLLGLGSTQLGVSAHDGDVTIRVYRCAASLLLNYWPSSPSSLRPEPNRHPIQQPI